MDGKKVYQIEIQGIKESIDAVAALQNKLEQLDAQITKLESKKINVQGNVNVVTASTTFTEGGGEAKVRTLQEEVALEKELNKLKNEGTKLEAKQVAYQDESYQKVLAQKDILKEIVEDQKAIAAQERLQADTYSNTMNGMKQKLSDLKASIASTDLGDSDQIKKMTQEANELTKKLKEMEEAYGQFGRNVGNYQSAAEGFNKFKITVGGVVREFGSAREASKQLKMELLSMDSSTKKAQDLREAIQQINSELQDIGKSSVAMDNLLDAMEGIVAVANVGQGIRGLFGVDDAEMQKSIKNLVALQNVLKGIESINKQINTGEGVGGWIKPFTVGIENATNKLLVYNRALLGTGKAAKVAAAGVKLFGKAVKMAISAGILLIIDQLVEKVMDFVEAMKKGSKAAQDAKKVEEEMNAAYAKGAATITNYVSKLKNFNGSKEEEAKLVKQLNSELGNSLGTYDSISKWYDVLTKKGAAYAQMLQLQAKAQAAFNNLVEAQQNEQKVKNASTEDYNTFGNQIASFISPQWGAKLRNQARVAAIQQATAYTQSAEEALESANKELEKFMEANKIGDYATQLKKTSKNTKDTVKKNEEELEQLRLKLMKEGLNKTLKQLDIEKNKLIEKIKANGKNVADKIKEVNDIYAKLRTAEIKNYIIKVEEELKNGAENISKIKFEVKDADLSNQIDEITEKIQNLSLAAPKSNTITTRLDYKAVDVNKLNAAMMYENLFNVADVTGKGDDFYKFLINYLKSKNTEVQRELLAAFNNTEGTQIEKLNNLYTTLENKFEEEYSKELALIRENQGAITKSLSESFEQRIQINKAYNESVVEQQIDLYQKLQKNEEERLNLEESNRLEDIKKEKDAVNTKLDLQKRELEDVVTNFKETSAATASFYENGYAKYQEYEEKLKALNDEYTNEKSVSKKKELETTITTLEKERDAYLKNNPLIAEYKAYVDAEKAIKDIQNQMADNLEAYAEKEGAITDEYANKRKQLETDTSLDIKNTKQKYYDNALTNLRDFVSATNDALNTSAKYFKGWGILDIGTTKKNLKEAKDAIATALADIQTKKRQLDKDFKNGLITPEERNVTMSQLNDMEKSFKEFGAEVKADLEDVGTQLWESINAWLQQLGQAANSILGSLSEITSNQYEAQISEQEKYIEQYEKLLDEQEKITQEHSSKINDIEDELKTARGDRRQQLIDNINAEMAAQRASLSQEKKIEKEKEKAEQKKKKLEHDQAVAKKRMDEAQAYINAAMAVSMAAVNKWPVPAIPMMALAAAVGAAQIAAVQSQNIPSYGDGGVIEGKSHSQGGVKVLGGRAEVEGGEYITNKVTTTKNVEVLDFINSRKKKLTLDDFVDFYGGNSVVRKNILQSTPRAKYADGGVLTFDSSQIDLYDRLLTAFEDYSNRAVQVAVVDIIDRTQAVNNVQVLAGLE